VNTSDFALGGVLSQVIDGEARAVAFYSRQLSPAEQNYEVYDRELLAIIECMKEWRHFLMGAKEKVTIFCDHKNLTYFRSSKVLTRRQARWSLLLEEFDFEIQYKTGKTNIKPDCLSRRPDYDEKIFSSKAILPDEKFIAATQILVPSNDPPVYSDILEHNIDLAKDWPLVILHFIEDHNWLVIPEQYKRKCLAELTRFTVKSNQLYRILDDKISTVKYVPSTGRKRLMEQFHVGLGHLKFDSLKDLIARRYWWPNWIAEFKDYIRNCPECQLNESERSPSANSITPIPPSGLPFERWGIDFIQDLPETVNGNRHIITAIDYATRWIVARAVPERTSAVLVKFLYEDILMNYGCPYEIFSDRASAILSNALQAYLELQTIRHRASTPYHPRTNGMVERMHSMMGNAITTLSNAQPDRWDEFLPQAIFGIRVRTHAVTKSSPFYLLYGTHPRIPGDSQPPREAMAEWTDDTIEDYITRNMDDLHRARGIAYTRSEKQAAAMKQRNARIEASDDYYFKLNDWVKLKKHNSTKFEFTWKGPYIVVDVGFPGTYWLMEPSGRRLDSTINQVDLAPWRAVTSDNISYFHDGTQRRSFNVEDTDEEMQISETH
jgi:transposase InsO family protein